MALNKLAYSIVQMDPPRDMRSAARLECSACRKADKLIITGMGNNPEKIEKMYIRMGWDADVHHHSRNICPKCVTQRKIRAGVEDRKPVTKEEKFAAAVAAATINKPVIPISSPKEVGLVIKRLSPEQKAELRQAIEDNFNPDTGRWEPGFSDHFVSETLGIPRVLVQEFRDNFYGELKEDPEFLSIKDQLMQSKTLLTNLQSTINKLELRVAEYAKKSGF